ncbi:MAG TPA: hypothetical protein VIF62_13485, partial [Labilithrix sp.]
ATRRRLADVLSGRAEPSPILYERPGGALTRSRAASGFVAGLIVLLFAFAIGFGDPQSARAFQSRDWFVVYGGACLLLTTSLLALLRRRARAGHDALPPGRYLLPLDCIEVGKSDAEGRQVIVVTPLGDARDARVRASEGRPELVVLFDGGEQIAFPLRADPEGDVAVRRLERSQRILEDLTYGRDLERSVALDPLFDVRADGSWDAVVAIGTGAPAGVARTFMQSPTADVVSVLLGLALGIGAIETRNHLSDRALFLRAMRIGTPEAYDAYLARGRSYRTEATLLRDRLLHAHEEEQKRREAPPPAIDDGRARAKTAMSCFEAMDAARSTTHRETSDSLVASLRRATSIGDPVIPVLFLRRVAAEPDDVWPGFRASLASRERVLVWALERVVSEMCPASVVKFAPARPSDMVPVAADDRGYEPVGVAIGRGLRVRYDVTWPKTSFAVHAPEIAFHIRFLGPDGTGAPEITLTMPPPQTMPTDTRERSLFLVPLASSTDESVARGYQLLTARAFDRLYDEIWSLFFSGDPRVPLRDPTSEAGR